MRQLRILLLALQPAGAVVSRHPVPLGGLWAGSDITDDLIESARKAMFPYEREAFDEKRPDIPHTSIT